MAPGGPYGHRFLCPDGGDHLYRRYKCSACHQVWRRHAGGADTFYWQAETSSNPQQAAREAGETWDAEGGAGSESGVEPLDALKRRLAAAEVRQGRLRITGDMERYLEATSLVDALQLVLDRRLKARLPAGRT